MGHVFLSYSRNDTDFVRRLHGALEGRGREVWADWEGIPPSDKWMARIHSAIDEAEALIFVISPDSLASEVCARELDYALEGKKRIIPVVCREPEGAVRDELAELNWIFARADDPFDQACDTLLEAVDTDLDWVKAHTRLNVRAREWERSEREASYTLRGTDLKEFEEWAAKAPDKEPKPTVLQSEYLLASRRAVSRRQRITWTSVTVGLCVAMVLGTLAWLQSRERARQQEIAGARRLLSRAEALREIPADVDGAQEQHEDGLLAATQALATLHALDENVFDADQSVRKSLARLSKWEEPVILSGGESIWSPEASGFSPAGSLLVILTSRSEILLMDAETGEPRHQCKRDGDAMERRIEYRFAVSGDGRRVALRTFGGTNEGAWNRLYVWEMEDCSLIAERQLEDDSDRAVDDVALTPDGAALIYWNRDGAVSWDLGADTEKRLPIPPNSRRLALSPDRRLAFTAGRVEGERAYRLRITDLTTGETTQEWTVPELVSRLAWPAGGLVVTTRGAHSVYSPDGRLIGTVSTPQGATAALSPDGMLIAAIDGSTAIAIRDVATDALVAQTHRDAQFKDLAFTPDGRKIVAISDYQLILGYWSFAAPGSYARLVSDRALETVWFAGDAATVHGFDGEAERTWRLPPAGESGPPQVVAEAVAPGEPRAARGANARSAFASTSEILAVAFGEPDREARLVCGESTRGGCRRTLEIWEGGSKRADLPYEPVLDVKQQAFLQFAGQDRYLVIGRRTDLEVLDWQTLEPVTELFHTGAVLAALSVDARRGATMDQENSIRVGDLAAGVEVTRLAANSAARQLALSNDDRWLAVITADGDVDLWALAAPDLINQACRWLESPCP